MSATSNFLAVDLGASSGRVFVGGWSGTKFELNELHRFTNGSVNILGNLHWDVLQIWAQIKYGFCCYAREHSTALAGIGVDAWGVDFALLDQAGHLVGNPYHYRDARTEGMPDAVFTCVPKYDVFCQTGNQPWQGNTLFQLFSMVHDRDELLSVGATFLMIPDLFAYWLTGEKAVEYTIGSTSQMLLKARHEWARELLCRLGIPTRILPPVVPSGTRLAPLCSDLAKEVAFPSAPPVIAAAEHDTASAVAAIPGMDSASAFISCGTWSIMGIETSEPITTQEALDLGFTNEGGAGGSVLFLRNLAGFWLLQECIRQWQRQGQSYTWEALLTQAEETQPFVSFIDPDSSDFFSPDDILAAIRQYCRRTSQREPDTVGAVVRCCLESLSFRYRSVLEALVKLIGRELNTIRIVGGGCKNRMLCQFTADASGRVVVAGPIEASALGNVMIQAVAAGHLSGIDQGRQAIAASIQLSIFDPHPSNAWEEGYQRFQALAN